MKLKLDENGNVVVQDGKPVYVHDDGKEVAFDAAGTVATITRLNGEAKSHRERAESAESKLKGFDGIEDGEAARKALDIVANLDQKKLVDAGQVEQVKAEAIKAVRAEYEPVVAERDKYKNELINEMIGGKFSRSKFAEEKVAVPRHMLQKTYGDSFKIEDGNVVAYDGNGAKIFSRARPGEIADFDEALETLISNDPYRDHILKSTNPQGTGTNPKDVMNNNGKKTITRNQFDAMSPAEKQKAGTDSNVTITD